MSSVADRSPRAFSQALFLIEFIGRGPRELWPYVLTWLVAILAMPFCWLVVSGALTQHVLVPPVETPKALAESGYTPEFLSGRIMAAMRGISDDSDSVPHDAALTDNDNPDFKLPGQDMSYASIVGFLKSTVFKDRQDVLVHIGITKLSDADDLYVAHIQVENGPYNGMRDDVSFIGNDFNKAVGEIAMKVMRLVEPNTLASHIFKSVQETTRCSLDKCDYGDVESIYDDVLARPGSPQRQWALAGQGWLLLRQNRSVEAEQQARDALLLYPHSAVLRANLGIALEQQQRIDAALKELRAGALEKGSTADNQRLLGDVLLHANRYDEALRAFKRADAMRHDDVNILHDWGEALVKSGHYEDAIARLARAVELRPDFAPSYELWGQALEGEGDLVHAAQKYAQADKRDSGTLNPHEKQLVVLGMEHKLPQVSAGLRRSGGETALKVGYTQE
jgi:tetratricopeptide (TPR) repeat protein